MSPIRTVIAGLADNVLTDIVERVFEHRLPLAVVARTDDVAEIEGLSRSQSADLVLLFETAASATTGHEELRAQLGGAALIVIRRDGRSACTCIDDPAIDELADLIRMSCRVAG